MQQILTVIIAGLVCASLLPLSSADENDSAEYVGPSSHFFPNPGDHTTVSIATEDLLFGLGSGPHVACFATADDVACDLDGSTAWSCGPLMMSSAEVPEGVLVQVGGATMDEHLSVCFASAGTVTVGWH